MNRREFVCRAATVTAGVALGGAGVFAQARQSADLVLTNGVIVTMDPRQPVTQAVAVKAGRILAVGDNPTVEALCDAATRRVDLAGRSLSPGLIDAHSHLAAFGQMELYFVKVRPPAVHSFDTLCRALAQAARGRQPGEWIVARGFNEFDEGRFPHRREIDGATPRNPVLAIHWSGQFGIANTLALREAGLLTAQAQDPPGAKYLRDRKDNVPNGCLLHYPAIYSVYQPTMTVPEHQAATKWGIDRFPPEGVTCVHDNFCNPLTGMRYVEQERAGQLPLRLRVYPYVRNLAECQNLIAKMRRYEGPLVRVQGVKLAVDGYPLLYDVPRNADHVNIPMHEQPELDAMIAAIHNAGMQSDVHAVGDRGVDMVLDAFERAAGSEAGVAQRRHRIEHYMFRKLDSIRRTADLGVPVCTQPTQVVVRGDDFVRKFGMAQSTGMVPLASFRREGVQVCFGADVPAFPTHLPMDSIRCAMQRTTAAGVQFDPAEAISFLEALEAHTIKSAFAAGDEAELGSIEMGKCADFAVWNNDLTGVTADNLDGLQVTQTYLAGNCVYGA